MATHFNHSIFYLLLLTIFFTQGSNLTTIQQLLTASEEGDLVTIKNLIETKKVAIDSQNLKTGNTALHYACQKEDKETIRYLLKHKAKFNIPNAQEETALTYVKKYRCSESIIKLFIAAGAPFKNLPLNEISPGIPLLKKIAPPEFFNAAKTGDFSKIKLFIEQGVDINSQDGSKNTILHYACEKNHEPIIDYLIDKKANLTIPGSNGNQALYNVCRYGSFTTFKRFADAKIINSSHVTPYFYFAIQGKNLEILRYFFENHEIDSNYIPSLYCYAINIGALDIVKYLIEERQVKKDTLFKANLGTATQYSSIFFYLLKNGNPLQHDDTDYLYSAIYHRQWPIAFYLMRKKYQSKHTIEELISEALEQGKKLEKEVATESPFDQLFPFVRALIHHKAKSLNILKISHQKKLVSALIPLTKDAKKNPQILLKNLSDFLPAIRNNHTLPSNNSNFFLSSEHCTKTPEEIWILINWLPHSIKISPLLSPERKREKKCINELLWYKIIWEDSFLHATGALCYFKNLQTLAKKATNKKAKNCRQDLTIYFS